MKVIDLLNKIANGEEVPKKIAINDREWIYDGIDYARESDGEYLFNVFIEITQHDLNIEVEIIKEDKKIEKIEEPRYNKGKYYIKGISGNDSEINDIERIFRLKINEIIDKLNEEEK